MVADLYGGVMDSRYSIGFSFSDNGRFPPKAPAEPYEAI
jgi:hypothetical protein